MCRRAAAGSTTRHPKESSRRPSIRPKECSKPWPWLKASPGTPESLRKSHLKKHCVEPWNIYVCSRRMKTFAESKYPGRLIAVEGLDGSGKSTQIYLLQRWLELQGLKVYFSEWNSSELVKSATSKGKKRELLTPTTFSLIHATDFADRYERHLAPLLRAGYLVLCDRYIFTAFARDVVRGCPPEWVRGLYDFAALPDLTFFFKADLGVSLQRILDGRPQLKYFEAGMDLRLSTDLYESFRIFQGRMLEQYLSMSTEFNFLVMDANQHVEKQQAVVRELVAQKLNLNDFRRAERPPPRLASPS